METFKLDKKYILAYWITFSTYILFFLVLMLTMGYSYNAPLNHLWIRRAGLVIFLGGWLIWYLGRKKLGHQSVDIDPLGDVAKKIIFPSYKKVHIKPKKIVSDGIYKITRHPQYWGTVLFYIGLAIALVSIPALAFAIIIVLPTHIWRAKVEEKMLEKLFGAQYLDYKKKTKF